MALQEYYNTGDNTGTTFTPTTWVTQTWTTTSAYNITSVKLKLYRTATPPDNVIIEIKATDGAGKPTGAALTTGSIAGSTVTESSPGSFVEIPLTPYALSDATKYAIVAYVDTVSASWRLDTTSPSYAGGEVGSSGDSGSSWTMFSTIDSMFEVYGGATVYEEGTKTVTVVAGVSLPTQFCACNESTKTVTAAAVVSLVTESYKSNTGFPTDRLSDYDGDKYWDEDSGTWVSTPTTNPGKWTQYVVAVSEEGEIYFRTL
jgi:hypothetical protein